MAVQPKEFPAFEAEIVDAIGECGAGHKKGDKFSLGCWDTGGMCGFFYHSIYPSLSLMQFGGKYPWAKADAMTLECPDRENLITLRVRKKK